jgi:hypothetical protein
MQLPGGRGEDRPGAVTVEVEAQLAQIVEPSSPRDDEEDAARLVIFVAQLALGHPVAAQLLAEPVELFGAAVPLQQQIDRAYGHRKDQFRVGANRAAHALAETSRRLPRPEPGHDAETRVADGRGDQAGDEAVDRESVCELRVRGPVVASLPVEVAAVELEAGGHQVGTSLVEQPVRLRLLPAPNRDGGKKRSSTRCR